jgi:1,4-alpha-glucan branching enzyme
VTGFAVESSVSGDRVFRIRVIGATRVELSGDFTSWQPVRLAPALDSWWTITLPLRPGMYELNVRVNGGPWLVPAQLLAITNEFGGAVGLLVIRE